MELQIETERLLIYLNEQEINRITQEAEGRARILNKILSFGLVTNDTLTQINSAQQIDSLIFQEQLKVNKPMAVQHKAGKKNLLDEYALPENLQALKDALTAWITYPIAIRGGNKYTYLIFSDHWSVDAEKLEREFVMRSLKIYVQDADLEELKTLQMIQKYLIESKAEPGQVFPSSFLDQRFTFDRQQSCNALPVSKIMIKKSYFRSI